LRGQSRNIPALSFFIFAETSAWRVYQMGGFIGPGGSKGKSVESEFFRIHRTDDLALLFCVPIFIHATQPKEVFQTMIPVSMVSSPGFSPGFWRRIRTAEYRCCFRSRQQNVDANIEQSLFFLNIDYPGGCQF